MTVPAPSVDLDSGTHSQETPAAPLVGTAPRLDGGGTFVPVQTRSERFSSTDHSLFAPVTGHEVDWKFTPVAKIRELIDGVLDGSRGELGIAMSGGSSSEWIARTDRRVGSAGVPEDRASANAWSTVDAALAITVSGDADEVVVTRNSFGSTARAAHTVITATANSSGHVVLDNSGSALLAENVEIVLEDGANLTVVTVQQWASDAVHLASHFARVGRNARLRHVIVSLDGAIVRINPAVHLVGDGAEVELFGAYFSTAGQHLEQQVFVDHDAPNTRSRVTYKGALQGAGARSVWIGDVLIRRSAVGTDSYEQNRNLLLSDGARADSIPNLEIETGDIAGAGHASASGRFDDEQLFYLQARGISEDEARRLVVRGFLAEVVQKVGAPELETRLTTAIDAALEPEGMTST